MKRIEYLDFLRGIAIIMVVAIHTAPGFSPTMFTDLIPESCVWFRHLVQPAVSIFLAISGYLMALKNLSDFNKCNEFWKK